MSLRNRRAVAPVSTSASTTMRPPTMCSPPAKRSIEDTSALRQHGRVTTRWASSSFTAAVMAIGLDPATRKDVAVRSGEQLWVVTWRTVGPGDSLDDYPGPEAGRDLLECDQVRGGAGVHEHHIEGQAGGVPPEHLEVRLRGETRGFVRLRSQVESNQPPGRRLVQG